jgi:hypothetical protein
VTQVEDIVDGADAFKAVRPSKGGDLVEHRTKGAAFSQFLPHSGHSFRAGRGSHYTKVR